MGRSNELRRKPPYKYVQRSVSKGIEYLYLRRPGLPKVRLRGPEGSAEFLEDYHAAMRGAPVEIGANRHAPGSLSALIARYFNTGEYKMLAQSTKATYRGILERMRAKYGDLPIAKLQRKHVKAMVDAMADRPAAAENFLRLLRMLINLSIVLGWRGDDPTFKIKVPRRDTTGFHTWTDREIAKFEATYAIGARERLALALLLYTAQRRSDVVMMGWQHVEGNIIRVKQKKTGTRLRIPIHPRLQEVLASTPRDQLTFLMTAQGMPFTPAGFGNWFRECCNAAGLSHCSAHGLRKAASRRLAEAGCTPSQIKAVTGHKHLSEVTRYTEAADQEQLATSAISTLSQRTDGEQ